MDLVYNAKIELREDKDPFFSEEEIAYYIYEKHDYNFNEAMYEMCMLKAENSSISLPGGLNIPDNAEYWKKQAKKYRKVRFI